MSDKIPSNASTATSPSPAIDTVAKNSWKGGVEHGTTSPAEAIANKYNEKPINPSSVK